MEIHTIAISFNCFRFLYLKVTVITVLVILFLFIAPVYCGEPYHIGMINITTDKHISFYNFVKNIEKYSQAPEWLERTFSKSEKPKWAKEAHEIYLQNIYIGCHEECKDQSKRCQISDWGSKKDAKVSKYGFVFGNKQLKYSHSFKIDEKDKIGTSLYIWIKENSDAIHFELPRDLIELYYVKFKQLGFICWKNKTNSMKYCEIDKF